jgi:hypothetical protein
MLETERLRLSKLSYADCASIFVLVNETSLMRYIGDHCAVQRHAARRRYRLVVDESLWR